MHTGPGTLRSRLQQLSNQQLLWICAVLTLIMLLEKEALAWLLIPGQQSLTELGFGFGHYIQSLLEQGRFVNCASESGHCEYASRMPILPMLMTGMAFIFDNQVFAALIKNLLLSILMLASVVHLLRIPTLEGRCRHLPLTLLVACLAPPVLKHASQITYEEGFLIELLLIWLFYFIASLQLRETKASAKALQSCLAMLVLLATILLLIKSSMILLWLLSIGLLLDVLARARPRLQLHLALSVMTSAILIGSWCLHVSVHTGRISVMSTYDGSNFYRAWNETALAIYPQVSLDRVIDTGVIELPDGKRVSNPLISRHPTSRTEEEWNRHYRDAGTAWIKAHPEEAWQLLLVKLDNFLLSTRKSPATIMGGKNTGGGFENLTISAWLVAGRIIEVLLLIKLWTTRHLHGRRNLWLLAALACYAAPYLAGFNYERHITPFLLLAFAAYFVLTEDRSTGSVN